MAVQSVAGVPKAAAATKLKVAKIGEGGYAVVPRTEMLCGCPRIRIA